jgi:hypothetical protein
VSEANIERLLTEDEARVLDSMRAAQAIIGGDPVHYSAIDLAIEVLRLRREWRKADDGWIACKEALEVIRDLAEPIRGRTDSERVTALATIYRLAEGAPGIAKPTSGAG